MTTACKRCGRQCKGASTQAPNARPFKRAMKGHCANCAVTKFFRDDDENGLGFALPAGFDPQGLRLPHIQAQFLRVLQVGGSEMGPEEIDWSVVIANWELPL